jgi:hypothetical protein
MDKIAAKPFRLGRVGGSLDLRLPREFVHANKLKDGDFLVLDLSKVGIVRKAELAELWKPALEPAE